MSDIANSPPPRRLAPIITSAAIVLCIIACTLIFLLPADSLVVDLIYQGF